MSGEPFVHLLISLWDCEDAARCAEFLTCLRRNRDNPHIARIHVFAENEGGFWRDEAGREKVTVVEHGRYASFADFFDYAARNLAGEVVAIANSDIHFDESLGLLRDVDLTDRVLALTRHNSAPYLAWYGAVWERNYGSQDVWIIRSPLRSFTTAAMPGWFGCDGLLAREFQQAGFRVLNPSIDIKTWHIHAQREKVTNLHTHPKSHIPGNVDPKTRHAHGFRSLPIEPLGRWKVYTAYREEDEELFRRWFVGTLQDDFDVVARRIERMSPPTPDETTEGGPEKIRLILEAIDLHDENGFFLFSDVDVQWVGPVQGRLRRLLAEFPTTDIFFQREARRHPANDDDFGTGLFVSKANVRTRAFWALVGECLHRDHTGDQAVVQRIIDSDIVQGLRVGFLPEAFWGPASDDEAPLPWKPGMFLAPPEDLLVHRANGTEGLPNKVAQLEYIARKIRMRSRRTHLAGKPAGVAIDHWPLTIGANFPHPMRRPASAAAGVGGNPLLRVVQKPVRLPGALWGVLDLTSAPTAAIGAAIPAASAWARQRCLPLMAMTAKNAVPAGIAPDPDVVLLAIESDERPDRRACLTTVLHHLPTECDKVVWLDPTTLPEEDDWPSALDELLGRYEYVLLRKSAVSDTTMACVRERIGQFKIVPFAEADVAANLSGLKPPSESWAARRASLESAVFVRDSTPLPAVVRSKNAPGSAASTITSAD